MSIHSFALIRCASGLSPGKPLKIGGGIFTLGGVVGLLVLVVGVLQQLLASLALVGLVTLVLLLVVGVVGLPVLLPSGGGGAPGPPPPPAPAPAPAGGGGGAAILNAQLSWLLNRTLWPNTGLPFLKPNYTLSKRPGHLYTICYWWVTSDHGHLRGRSELSTTGYGHLA